MPRLMVDSEAPDTLATAAIPPRPRALASIARYCLLCHSSSRGRPGVCLILASVPSSMTMPPPASLSHPLYAQL